MKIDGGEMRRCPGCGLLYAEPRQLPDTAAAFFAAAYRGEVSTPGMRDIGIRLPIFQNYQRPDTRNFLYRGAHLTALDWLKANAPTGSTILDIGCGPGAFLHLLRQAGFIGTGVEPSDEAVTMLKLQGFDAHKGTIENIPTVCPADPFAITCHFLLHHLIDPAGTIASLKTRYPRSFLLVTEGNAAYIKKFTADFLPPRALTLWQAPSLKLLLNKAGYEVAIIPSARRPQEYGLLPAPTAARLFQALEQWLPASRIWSVWHRFKKYLFLPVATAERLAGRPPATLLAIGHPQGYKG